MIILTAVVMMIEMIMLTAVVMMIIMIMLTTVVMMKGEISSLSLRRPVDGVRSLWTCGVVLDTVLCGSERLGGCIVLHFTVSCG